MTRSFRVHWYWVLLFCLMSHDWNPLHWNPWYARKTRFGGRIAHGMFVAAFISASLAKAYPGCVYLRQELKFTGPVHFGDTIRVILHEDGGLTRKQVVTTQVINGNGKLVIDGTGLVLRADV